MTKTTARPPLPYTREDLRRDWLPPEPDTTVTATRAAQQAIWAAVVAATAEVEQLEAAERAAVIAIVDAAIAGDDFDQAVADLGRDSEVPAARHRLELLRLTSTTVDYQLNEAQRSDPVYVPWVAACRHIEDVEWPEAMNADDRTAALLDFAERHRPS